jgi:hypothetical protein
LEMDFTFLEVEIELNAIGTFLDMIERIIKEETAKARHSLLDSKSITSEEERCIASQEFRCYSDYLYPKLFRGAYIISLWAVYEYSILRLKELYCGKLGVSNRAEKTGGRGNFIKKIKSIFEKDLKMTLHSSEFYDQIRLLYALRNCYVHASGYIESTNKKKNYDLIRSAIKKDIGIRRCLGHVIVDSRYTKEIYNCVSTEIQRLIKEYHT